ncbi:MAG: GatB/YqeY domain-containing protein, partial [Clostridia bacterium]|nr:GatB/YqeY domain-containing protein [Clostridia bacterium]
ELTEIIKEVISETGAQSMRDIGKVMAAVRPKTKGRADGKQINAIAKELLS